MTSESMQPFPSLPCIFVCKHGKPIAITPCLPLVAPSPSLIRQQFVVAVAAASSLGWPPHSKSVHRVLWLARQNGWGWPGPSSQCQPRHPLPPTALSDGAGQHTCAPT